MSTSWYFISQGVILFILVKDPSLLYQLQRREQQVEALGHKWWRKLSSISIGHTLDWPLWITLRGLSRPLDGGDEDLEEEIRFLVNERDEFDAENTEVDDFLVDCLAEERFHNSSSLDSIVEVENLDK